ncbi:MAG TPA: hypothetical protein VF616_32260 [Duganella sp.]|uniref:leucine-rich repeat domain-containing protein n=1 Tax=Duganella sp. TaxID=1904440 RepID=UPI002ED0483D
MSAAATDFGAWWARRDDPTLLHDEHVLLYCIGQQVSELAQRPTAEIDPDTAARAAARITKLEIADCFGDTFSSLEPLPRLLDAPLRSIELHTPTLRDLAGIETFSTLTTVVAPRNGLTSVAPLAGLGALETLDISDNSIDSLAPLAGAVHLKSLNCAGNRIGTLEPLRHMPLLESLTMCGMIAEVTMDDKVLRPFVLLDNPIDDASMLADHPLLGNILMRADRMDMWFYERSTGKLMIRTEATRVGHSNRFVAPHAGTAETFGITICSLSLIRRADVDRLVVAVHLEPMDSLPMCPTGAVGVAIFDTAGRGVTSHSATVPLIDNATDSVVTNAIGAGRSVDFLLDCRRKVPFA